MQFWAYIAAGLVAGILGRLFFKMIFKDYEDFWDCVVKFFTPDLLSLFRGEFFEDFWKSLKLWLFLILVVASTWITYDYVKGLGKKKEPSANSSFLERRNMAPALSSSHLHQRAPF